ncbi:hypothetical protein D3C73_1326440 [compost metagenome]
MRKVTHDSLQFVTGPSIQYRRCRRANPRHAGLGPALPTDVAGTFRRIGALSGSAGRGDLRGTDEHPGRAEFQCAARFAGVLFRSQ